MLLGSQLPPQSPAQGVVVVEESSEGSSGWVTWDGGGDQSTGSGTARSTKDTASGFQRCAKRDPEVGWGQHPAAVALGRDTQQDLTEPISHPSLAELDMVQLSIMGLATILTLVSVAIYVEEAIYLTHKIRCPIKMKTLRWSSSAPTVSWGWGRWGGSTRGTRGV